MDRLVLWQRIEGAGVFAAGIALFLHAGADIAWWAALLIFFAPDLGFAAYLAGPKFGAWGYNILHLQAFGAGFLAAGLLAGLPVVAVLGALWLAHAGLDRMLGYGLKSETGFHVTHLGRIGRAA